MKIDPEDIANLLEEPCPLCKDGDRFSCRRCDREGKVLTALGEAILDLVERRLKVPLPNSDPFNPYPPTADLTRKG